MYSTLKYEVKGHVGYVTISRPEALNALNSTVLTELYDLFTEIENDDNVRVAVLTGDGRSFVAGADIAEMSTLSEEEATKFALNGYKTMFKIENNKKPVIAAINGFALGGGCEISMACDIRIASSKAVFGQPEAGLGITPGFGGTQRLAKIVGPGMASKLILSATNIKADEALRIGLVEQVVEPEELIPTVEALANTIASKAPVAVMNCKKLINDGLAIDHEAGCDLEAKGFGACFATTDQKEGMKAFLGKTTYEYQGK